MIKGKNVFLLLIFFVLFVSNASASTWDDGYKTGYNDGSSVGANQAHADNAAYGNQNLFSAAPECNIQTDSRDYRSGYKSGYREGYYCSYRNIRYI
jgi:transcription elongation factor